MRPADLRTNGAVFKRPSPKDNKPPTGLVALVFVLALAVVGIVGYMLVPKERAPEPIPGVPQEVVGKNKVLLRDYEDRRWLSYSKQNSHMLGDPIFSERPLHTESACVGFTNYTVCYKSDPALKGTIWQFQPMLLGASHLPPTVQPNDRSELAEIVKDYLILLEQQGIDRFYWLGTVQAPYYCSQNGKCYQVFQRQVLTWDKSDTKAEKIKLSPLGEEANEKVWR